MDEIKDRQSFTRVTSILYPFSGLDKIDPFIVAKAGERGTKVHKICEAIVEGLGEIGTDEETWGYVESFKKWWATEPKIIAMEKRFWNDEHEITGQVDLIVQTPDGVHIVDLKTSYRPSKTWAIQGAAYAYLAQQEGYDVKGIQFLHLSKIGKEPTIYDYPINNEFFLDVMRVWKYFFKEK